MLSAKRLALRRSRMWARDGAAPLPRRGRRLIPRMGQLLLSLALLASLGRPTPAQRRPLPPEEQEGVNKAIDRGVQYLKKTQQKNGTWAAPDVGHPVGHSVGYAALSALTLLECGVPPNDPVIQRTARYVRSQQATVEGTYDLSLGILLLDRLGDPKDKKLIQKYALRLVAGQTATGGWGYKCPRLSRPVEMELMTAL